ncbi:M20/M25/M40 family metallo-hydrolase [Empedobacter stercoris]|uniref:M20/M25/M40 family metallo-hydrolase n=1 Tax=Empedobacter stercoris TaxID=1628248 RepID=UPI00166256DE|nr:M20/M25/M40 family metallo-hydrolase [Empedobacter stercoris]MCA4809050.1 M20/M25/M40 family metallo-hydrolase [Empedobacter stercoris]QNT14184.1 M20/M25/M40 family metallo-hydrolase [Empedobacter stercoris]
MNKIMIVLPLIIGAISFAQDVEVKNLKKHIYYLADDKMKGRGTGSDENLKAAKYIAKEFKKYKLLPLGEDGYFQGFDAKVRKVKVVDSIRSAKNVIGFLDNKAKKTIVIGAHYDHLGEGKQGSSLAKDSYGIIHNGADDNASGVAGLLELARVYSKNKITEPVNFLFIAFGAEELGLVGSRHFVKHPTYDLTKIHWMLNMDMIGRLNKETGVSIIGYGTSPTFETIFNEIDSTNYVKFYTGYEGRGGSDQTSFYEKNIPVLFFHTGGHDDYHKPTDDAEKIDYTSLKAILLLEKAVIEGSFKIEEMPFRSTDKE